jgi:hypothetical protein
MASATFERFRFSFFEDPDSPRNGLDMKALAALEGEERSRADAQMVTALMTIYFEHRQSYHHKSGPAHIYCMHLGNHFAGLERLSEKRLRGGISLSDNFSCPDTRMILIAGQRSCTACASCSPSILPGI